MNLPTSSPTEAMPPKAEYVDGKDGDLENSVEMREDLDRGNSSVEAVRLGSCPRMIYVVM